MKNGKKILSVLLTLCMLLGMLPAALAAETPLPFQDLEEGAWYTEAVRYAYENKLMDGTGDGNFSPDATTTRATLVTLLHRSEGKPAAEGAKDFPDVPAGTWYTDAVAWASGKGIVNGYDDGKFHPDDVITREQFATVLYRYAQSKGLDVTGGDLSGYPDADTVSSWARYGMAWAVKVGLINGMGDGTLSPLAGATRAQAAAILMRYRTKVDTAAVTTPTPAPSKKPSSGGSGGGSSSSGSGSSKTAIQSVTLTKGGTPVSGKVAIGDELSYTVTPEAATYDVEWSVTNYTYTNEKDVKVVISAEKYEEYKDKTYTVAGDTAVYTYTVGKDTRIVGTGDTYTVTVADASGTVSVKATGTGDYTGEKTASAEVKETKAFVPEGEKLVRVSVDSEATFKDASGNELELPEDSQLKLTIAQDTPPAAADVGVGGTSAEKTASVLNVMKQAAGLDGEIDAPADGDLGVNYASVAVELKLVTEDTEEVVHPVGETVVLLSKAELGVPEADNLEDYIFFAQHTVVGGTEPELQPGVVVTMNGTQYVQFTLGGLSQIWIGNVPPRTVTWDTLGGTPVPEAQKVKFGGFAKPVEAPKKEGFIFTGWDHDLAVENVIWNMVVKAIWVEGKTASDDQLIGTWSDESAAGTVTKTVADGTVTLELLTTETYAPDLTYTLTMAEPEGGVKYAVASTADGALASTEYKDVATALPAIEKPVTDASGKIKTSSTTLYVKWVKADNTPFLLQSMTLKIRTEKGDVGSYDTETRQETFEVDRGLGRVSFYLTGGKATPNATTEDPNPAQVTLPDYEGNINAYLRERTYSGETGYHLEPYGNFYERFYIVPKTESQEADYSKGEYSAKDYATLKIVIDPFEGESFSGTPTVEASYWESETQENVTVAAQAQLSEGKILVTCPISTLPEKVENLDFIIELAGQAQDISVYVDRYSNPNSSSERAETWAQARELLAAGKSVHYDGTENVVLTDTLTLNEDQNLQFQKASLTVGQGGRLEMKGTQGSAAHITISNGGTFTVADGGVLAALSQDPNQHSYTHCGVSVYNYEAPAAGTVTIARGGKIEVEYVGCLSLMTTGQILVEEGAQVIDEGYMIWNRSAVDGKDPAPANKVAGTVKVGSTQDHYTFFDCNDTLEVTSTGSVTFQSKRGRLEVNGGLINEGTVSLSGGADFTFSGATENRGTITLAADAAALRLANTGYSVQNFGTITVGSTLDVTGTVLVNTGTISGAGKLTTGDFAAVEAAYDEVNGLAYVNEEINEYVRRTAESYPHYKFTADPAATVEATVFVGTLDNQDGGTCTLTVENA